MWHGQHGFIRQSHGPGWALVGDAGYFQDPISAHAAHRRATRRRTARSSRARQRRRRRVLDAALEKYESTRDRLSVARFDVVDRIASQQWDGAEMADLQLQLSSAMANEVEVLAALESGAGT